MNPDPCHTIDPFVDDVLSLNVWLPREPLTDTIEQCTSAQLGVWKVPGVCEKWWAPVFAMTFVCCDEGMAFETFGVN